MNRRAFLSFLSVAPVAATCAAFMPSAASPEFVVGIDLGGHDDMTAWSIIYRDLAGNWRVVLPADYQLDSSVIGESVPQTALSPERLNQKNEHAS